MEERDKWSVLRERSDWSVTWSLYMLTRGHDIQITYNAHSIIIGSICHYALSAISIKSSKPSIHGIDGNHDLPPVSRFEHDLLGCANKSFIVCDLYWINDIKLVSGFDEVVIRNALMLTQTVHNDYRGLNLEKFRRVFLGLLTDSSNADAHKILGWLGRNLKPST